ncbi:MAG: JAB domain-containing protein [Cyanobacteria bacterium P01_H01_bin.153]
MYVHDCAGPYTPAATTTTLSALIDVLLGYSLGQEILADLIGSGEQVSPQNLQDRLRVAIRAGALPRLTSKRLEKLQAALELGRQLYVEETSLGEVIDTPGAAAAVFSGIAWEPVEKFAIACLDVRHRLLSCEIISSGTATETLAHPRDIFATLLRSGATRAIVAHNHPSGSTEPSQEDISLTQQFLAASNVMGIPILDHLVVSRGGYTSIRQGFGDLWNT